MYYEDFEIEAVHQTPGRVVTEDDLNDFIRLSGLDNPIFATAEGAAAAGHEDRLVPAPLQLSLVMGLCQAAGLFDHVAAVLQFDRLRFHRPVHPGDSLTLTARVSSRRETSRPDRGLVVLDYTVHNGRGETVMTALATYLMRRRQSGEQGDA